MDFFVETVKGGFGELGRGSSRDERRDGQDKFEGFIGVFILDSFGSIGYFPFDLGIVKYEGLEVEDMCYP